MSLAPLCNLIAPGLMLGCVEFSQVPLRLKLMFLTFESFSALNKVAVNLLFSLLVHKTCATLSSSQIQNLKPIAAQSFAFFPRFRQLACFSFEFSLAVILHFYEKNEKLPAAFRNSVKTSKILGKRKKENQNWLSKRAIQIY